MATKKTTTKKIRLTKALKKQGVTASDVKKVNQSGKTVVIVISKTAPRGRSFADSERTALKPGKRLTTKGKVYTENRKNRSDVGKSL
jgi:hypothetical protein